MKIFQLPMQKTFETSYILRGSKKAVSVGPTTVKSRFFDLSNISWASAKPDITTVFRNTGSDGGFPGTKHNLKEKGLHWKMQRSNFLETVTQGNSTFHPETQEAVYYWEMKKLCYKSDQKFNKT